MLEITGLYLQTSLGSSSMKSDPCIIGLCLIKTLQASDNVFEKVTSTPPISHIVECHLASSIRLAESKSSQIKDPDRSCSKIMVIALFLFTT